MKPTLFYSVMIGILLSLVISKIIYFGFTPNYAADIFSRETFNGRFDHDVYKYRILSKYLLFAVDEWLGRSLPEKGAESRLSINTPGASERFYLAFYYLNTFFLVLTTVMVALLLDLKGAFRWSVAEQHLVLFLVPLLIGISEFTVCCYDVSSYFFQFLILYLFLRYSRLRFYLTIAGITGLIVLSTLNRESSALSVSIVGLLLFTRFGFTRRVVVGFVAVAAAFLITYVALRFFVVDAMNLRIVNIDAGKVWMDTNMVGLLFWGLFLYLPLAIAELVENRWLIGVYLFFSTPYILTCLKDGVLWEIRLFVPLFLGALFLSKLDVLQHVVRVSEIKWKQYLVGR